MTNINMDKRRGRKRIADGGKSSPRKVYCSCAAIINGNLVLEQVHCGSNKDTPSNDMLFDAARNFFDTKYGQKPEKILGPYFQRKGVMSEMPKDTLSVSIEDVNLVPGKLGMAIYKDWNVSVRFLEGHDDVVYLIYKNHLNEDKKIKPSNKVVRMSALKNLEMVTFSGGE